MIKSAQIRANQKYRERLARKGVARFELMALETDRALLRSLAKRLAENDANAQELRATIRSATMAVEEQPGSILHKLRQSPLVDADLSLQRDRNEGRRIEF